MNNLFTLAEYKAYQGISSTTQDGIISAIIPNISQYVKTICRRTFNDYVIDAKIDTFNGGFRTLILSETPVLSVSSVEYSTNYGSTYTTLVEFTDWTWDKSSDMIYCLNSTVFPSIVNGYKITYLAGYTTLPKDLKLAAMDLLTYYIKNDMAVKSPKVAGSNTVQIEYITKNTLPSHIQRVLDLYTASFD